MFLQRGVLQPRKEAAVNFGCPPVYHCILLEGLKGKSFNDISSEELKKLEISFTNVFSLDQLINLLVSFTTSVKARISEETMEPEYLFDELIYKTLNIKTENPKVIEIFIDCFCNLQIGHCIRTKVKLVVMHGDLINL